MLNYLDVGPKHGEIIVFIHGLGNRKETWFPQLTLSEKYRLILVELRGHGQSDNNDNLNVETFAKDILEVLDFLNIEQTHFCGLSLGGLVVQEIYKQQKNRVKSMILSNTTFYIPNFLGIYQLEKYKQIIKKVGYGEFQKRSIDACFYQLQDETMQSMSKEAFLIREDTFLKSTSAAFGRNYAYTLISVDIPTTIISSLEDRIVTFHHAILIKSFVRDSSLVVLKNTGHLSNIEQAETYNKTVEQHVESVIHNSYKNRNRVIFS